MGHLTLEDFAPPKRVAQNTPIPSFLKPAKSPGSPHLPRISGLVGSISPVICAARQRQDPSIIEDGLSENAPEITSKDIVPEVSWFSETASF